ncbi:hypothetical protein GGU10DRAFT_41162 [Lentinula aff. detonsa]|uniref:Uncharacterized protein n=1 Tax=Lentinula aff. detonsa TaxID=2804958 RepID=A0AA38KFD2_9AGAR|nr:hypothetical protein GGU10DRAFT_41162 [Lentinula aff. detonsa]
MRRAIFFLPIIWTISLVAGQIPSNISVSQAVSTTIVNGDGSATNGASGTSPSLESLDQQPKTSHTAVLLPVIIAVIFLIILCMGSLYFFRRRWMRRNWGLRKPYATPPVATPSILSFSAGFSVNTEGRQSGYTAVPNPYTYYIPPPALARSMSPDRLTLSTSFVSLPKSLYEPVSAATLSPAAPSSEVYGHMLSVEGERIDEKPKPLRLVPLRRVDSEISEDI